LVYGSLALSSLDGLGDSGKKIVKPKPKFYMAGLFFQLTMIYKKGINSSVADVICYSLGLLSG